MAFRNQHLVIPLAGVLFLGLAASALAQSAAASRGHNGAAASLKAENRGTAVDTGKNAIARDRARRAVALASSSAAPVALAVEFGPPPDSNPEPLTVVLVGGALAGLYRMRRHIA